MSMYSSYAQPIGISGIGPVCPRVTSLSELIEQNMDTTTALAAAHDHDWFDPRPFLGKRGYKYLTPATRYVLGATQVALEDARLSVDDYPLAEKGIIIGTNFAVAAVHEAMDAVIMNESSDSLSPMEAANFSVNLAASHISIKHGFRAFNISFTNPMVAGIEALLFGANAIRQRRAQMVVAGATEDTPAAPAAEALGVPLAPGGACTLVLESLASAQERQARLYGVLGAGALRFINPQHLQDSAAHKRLVERITHDLARLVPPEMTTIHYCPLTAHFPLNQAIHAIVCDVLGTRQIEVKQHAFFGATGAHITVSPLLQLGALLHHHGSGLLVATSPHGHIALMMVYPATA